MSNLAAPDEKHTKQLGADSVAGCENYDPAIIKDKEGDDINGTEAVVREVIDRVCQMVSEVCLTVESDNHIIGAPSPTLNVPQSSCSASIKRCSVEAADESSNSRDSSDSETSQFNEPVALNIVQEKLSPKADDDSVSSTVDADALSPDDDAGEALQPDDAEQVSQDHQRLETNDQSQSHRFLKDMQDLPDSPKNLERIADQQTQATQESNLSTESLIELIKDMHPPAPLENPDFVESVSIEHNAPTPITGSIEEKVDQSVAVEQLRIDKSNDQVEPVLEVKQTFASDKRDSTKPHTSRNMDSSPAQNLIVSGNSEEIQRSEIASENRLAIKEQHISPVAVAVEVQNYRIDASQESVCKEDQDGSSQHLTSTQKTKLSPTFSGQSRYSDSNLELQANRSGDTDNESNKFHFEQLPTAVSIVEDYCSSDSNSPDLTIEQHDVTDFVKKQSEHEPQHCEEDSSQISGELQTEQQHNQKAAAAAQSSENDHHQIEIDFQKSPETSESDADIQEATLTLDDLPDNETNKAEPTDLSDIDTVNNIQLPSESANKSHFKTDANLGDEGLIETRDSQTIVAEAPEKSLSFPVASIVKYEAVSSGAYSLVQNRTESDNTFSAVSQLLSDLCLKVASSMEATASDSEEENEDLMSELQGAKHVSGAAAEGEADDDYMSELCGDGQLAKAVQSPMDTETDLMKELSGGGNQLTNVITLSEDSGDEDDTESKLVLCTSTTLGQSGSADIEAEVTSLVEAGAEVVSGSVSLPSTSTPALLQIKSAAPVAASIASTTADALANIKAMAALASGSSSDELAALKRRLEQLEAENKMLKQSIQPASTDSVTTAPAAPTLTSNAVVSTSATSGTAGSGMQHPQADSSGSPQSFSSYDSSSQNYIPAGGFLKSLSEIEEAGGACADATVSTPSTTPQQQQQTTLDSGIASVVTAAAAVPASTIATAAIQGPVCSISGGASTAAGSIPATITPSGQIQFILPPGVLPSSFAGLTAVPTVQPSLSSTVPLSVTAATAVATTTATTSTAKLTTPLKSAPTPSKLSQSASASSSASTPSNRRIRTIAPKPIAMRPILPSPKTDMSTKLPPIQLSSKNASATSASTTSGKKSKTSTAASKKPTQPVTASSTAMHAAMPAGMPMAMQLPSGALAAVSQSKSLPVVVGTPIGMCASMGSLLAGAGISMPVNHSSGTAVWAAAPPGATFATTWAQTAPTAVVFSTGQPLSAGSLEGTALPSHDLLAIACQEAGLSLDLDLGSTVMISTSQDSGTPMIEGVGCEQQSATVTDLGGLVDAQQGSSFLHELGLIQPPQEDGVIEQQTPAEVSHSAESVIHCPPLQQQQLSQDPTGQQQQQQQQQCWNTTTFDDFNAALNDFNSDAVTTTSAPTQPSPASKTTHGASRTPTKSATTKNSDASTCGAASAASAFSQLSVSTESNATPLKMTAPAVSPAKKSHHKAKTTPPIPSASGSSSTNQPAVSVSATSVEVANVSSGKQQSAQAHKSKPKKKSSALQQTSIPEKRGGTSKKTTPAKDREAKATSSAAKQQSEIGDDTELFKEIIPLKSAVHKLSENDEIEEAVKGIVGFSSLEDTISGVLKAGEAADAVTPAKAVDVGELSRLTSPTKCSSDQRPAVTTPTSQAPPPPSSSSISQPTLQQLAELAAAGDSCPVVSIPESAGLPFGDISCLATAEVSDPVSQLASTDTFIKKSSAIPPCVSESKEEDWLSSKKKSLQGKKTTTSAARQDPSAATSTSSGSQNKRRSTDATPPGPSSKDKLAPDDKPHKSSKGTSSESRTKELVKRKEKSSLHEPAKKSNPLPSLGTETNDSKSKEAATAKLDKPKASSRSALYRSKLSTSEKSAAPETSSSTRSESSERKQKQDKESSSKNNASEFGPEPAVKELVKVSGKSKSIEDLKPIATSSKSKSSSKKMNKKKGSKLSPSKPVKVFDEPTKESTHFSSLRRSERSRSVNKLKRDDSRESRRPQSSVSTSEVASVGGGSNSSKSIRTSRRIAEKSVEKRRHSGSRSRSAQAGRLSDVDTDSSEDDSNESEAADTEKQVVVKSNFLKKTATSTASLSSGSNSPTKISGGSKFS